MVGGKGEQPAPGPAEARGGGVRGGPQRGGREHDQPRPAGGAGGRDEHAVAGSVDRVASGVSGSGGSGAGRRDSRVRGRGGVERQHRRAAVQRVGDGGGEGVHGRGRAVEPDDPHRPILRRAAASPHVLRSVAHPPHPSHVLQRVRRPEPLCVSAGGCASGASRADAHSAPSITTRDGGGAEWSGPSATSPSTRTRPAARWARARSSASPAAVRRSRTVGAGEGSATPPQPGGSSRRCAGPAAIAGSGRQ